MDPNPVLGGVIVAVAVVASLAGRRSKGGARLTAAQGAPSMIVVAPPGGGPITVPKARRKRGPFLWLAGAICRLVWWLVRRAIWAAGRWPRSVGGAAVAGLVGVWLAVTFSVVGGRLAGVMSAPLAALAVYAATRRFRRSDTEGYAARWRHLADPVKDPATGKVVEPAAVPNSRVKGGATVLTDQWTGLEMAVRLVVRTGRVRDVVATVRKAVPVIAKVYATDEDCVTVEAGADNGEAVVTIVPAVWAAHVRQLEAEAAAKAAADAAARVTARYPLTAAHVTDRATGAAPIGVQVESGDPAFLEVFCPGIGARHCLFAGDTRFGKSTTMEAAVKVAVRSGVVAPAFIDMAGGVTFDYLKGSALGYAATVKDARALLQALDAEYERRVTAMVERGWRGRWEFSEQDPAIPVVVDESPELKGDPECQRLLSRAARMWAKTGMGVWLATQVTTITAVFSDDAGMGAMSQFMAGNLLSVYSNRGLAGFKFDAKDIPQVPGVLKMTGPLHLEPVLFKGLIDESGAPLSGMPPFRLPDAPAAHEAAVDVPVVPDSPAELDGWAGWAGVDPRARIVALLSTGPRTEREIHEMTGMSTTRVHEHVKALSLAGRLVKTGGYGSPWALSAGR